MNYSQVRKNVIILLCLSILLPFLAQNVSAQAKVILYEKENYGGKSLILTSDAADVNGTPHFFGKVTSSIKLEGVSSVAVYDRTNYQGNCQAVTSNIASLKNTFIGNDTILSVKLNASCETGPAVILYEKKNFDGNKLKVSGDIPSLQADNYKFDDDADSVQLSDGATSAALYEQANYGGSCVTLTSDISDLDKTSIGRNKVSSLKVNQQCSTETPGVYLFEDNNYEGKSILVTGNTASLKASSFNDKTSSLKLNKIQSIAAFENENWEGKCETFKSDTPSLKDSTIGNDKISSIKINSECENLVTLTIKNHSATVIKYSWAYYNDSFNFHEKKLAGGQSDKIFLDKGKELYFYVDMIDLDMEGKVKCRYEPLVSNNDVIITAKGVWPNVTCDLKQVY